MLKRFGQRLLDALASWHSDAAVWPHEVFYDLPIIVIESDHDYGLDMVPHREP